MITVHTGETFTVDFQATPATGYQWSVADLPAGVEFLRDSFTPATAPTVLPATGTHSFHFKATRPGPVELHFELKRSWEPEGIEQRTVGVKIRQ